MPQVSVIIPAHQEQAYIARTLKSIQHPETEVIVVANGCTDDTAKIAQHNADSVFSMDRRGVSRARNLGARAAKGSTLIFLDADIHLQEDTISKIIESKHDIGTCYAKPDVDKFLPKALMQLKKPFQHIGWSSGLIFCTKELYDKVGGFDESIDFGEDGKFLREAKRHGNYGVVNSHVINSMRRFEKQGYARWIFFWIKNIFKAGKQGYTVVR